MFVLLLQVSPILLRLKDITTEADNGWHGPLLWVQMRPPVITMVHGFRMVCVWRSVLRLEDSAWSMLSS